MQFTDLMNSVETSPFPAGRARITCILSNKTEAEELLDWFEAHGFKPLNLIVSTENEFVVVIGNMRCEPSPSVVFRQHYDVTSLSPTKMQSRRSNPVPIQFDEEKLEPCASCTDGLEIEIEELFREYKADIRNPADDLKTVECWMAHILSALTTESDSASM